MYLRNVLSIAGVFSVLSTSAMNLDEILVGSENDSQKVEILTRVLAVKEGENAKLRTDLSQKTLAVKRLLEIGNELVVELGESIALLTADVTGNEALRAHQTNAVIDLRLLELVRSLEQIRPGNWEDCLKHQLEADEGRAIVTGILNDQLAVQRAEQPQAAQLPAVPLSPSLAQ